MVKSCIRLLVALFIFAACASEVIAYKSKDAGEIKKGWMGEPPF